VRIADASAVVLIAVLASCVSGRDCAKAIPEDLRADAIRFALDRGLVEGELVPRGDYALALGAGLPYAQLGEDRRALLSRWAAGYSSCIKERVER
jgi:hypothetical protein